MLGDFVLSGVPQGSVLGPILFIIFINELAESIKNPCKLYADDTKIIASVKSPNDAETLQADINYVVSWCNEWLMCLNVDKCKVMHVGKSNPRYLYHMATSENTEFTLSETEAERDLGVVLTSDLKWHHQTMFAANKANKMLGMLRRTFVHWNPQLLKTLYTTFVRPHIEFAVGAVSPYSKIDIEKFEKVQRRATRLDPSLRCLSYENRLEILKLTTLHTRRIRGDLIQAYKIINNIDVVNWLDKKSLSTSQTTTTMTTRGHHLKLTKEIVKNCEQRFHFFTNRVVNFWNALPSHVVTAPSVNSFKEMTNSPPKFYLD